MSTNSRMLHTRIYCTREFIDVFLPEHRKAAAVFQQNRNPRSWRKLLHFKREEYVTFHVSMQTIQRLGGFWFYQTQHESLFSYKFQIIKLLWRSTVLKHSNTHIQDIYLSYLRCKEAWQNFGGLKEPMNNLQLSVGYAWFQRPFWERFLPAVFSHHFPNTKKNTYWISIHTNQWETELPTLQVMRLPETHPNLRQDTLSMSFPGGSTMGLNRLQPMDETNYGQFHQNFVKRNGYSQKVGESTSSHFHLHVSSVFLNSPYHQHLPMLGFGVTRITLNDNTPLLEWRFHWQILTKFVTWKSVGWYTLLFQQSVGVNSQTTLINATWIWC